MPLCVPRDPQLKEHVDGHQQRFAAVAAREGLVRTVLSQETFDDELDQTLARAADGCDPGTPNNVRVAARALVAAELDELLDLRPFRVARLHRSYRIRRRCRRESAALPAPGLAERQPEGALEGVDLRRQRVAHRRRRRPGRAGRPRRSIGR